MKRADLCIRKSPSGRCSCAWEHWKGFSNLPCAVITWKLRLTILFSECSLIRRANIFLGPFFSFFFFSVCTFKLTYLCPTNVTLGIKADIRSCAVILLKDSVGCLNPMLKHTLPYTESKGYGRSLPAPRKHLQHLSPSCARAPGIVPYHNLGGDELDWFVDLPSIPMPSALGEQED